jgi:uncharacterized OB-fold protein
VAAADPGPVRVTPLPDGATAGFWAAAAEGRLVVRACADCGRRHHPPRLLCPWCGAADVPFAEVSGRARLHSWTVTEHPVLPAQAAELPYLCLVVELAEQDGLFLVADGIGLGIDPAGLRRGLAMRVVFDARAGDVVLPRFVPAPEEGR